MRPVTLNDYKRRLLRVIEHIHENLDEPLPLATLAGIAHLSPFHFHRVFTGMLGETVQGLVRRLRLERAAWQLRQPARPGILDVALDAGYDSHEAFSRAFGRAFTVSPSRFRGDRARPPRLRAHSGVHYDPAGTPVGFRSRPVRPFAMKVTIKHLPSVLVACVRHVGPYENCGIAWEKICTLLGAEGYIGPGSQLIGISYDDPENTPPAEIRYDAAISVPDDFVAPAGVTLRRIAGGDYAVLTHQGPYNQVSRAYRHLMGEWLPRSGRELADEPCFESYLNDPDNTPPAELLTDVYLPLAPLPASAHA
ncbi:AraC family transcriptional regulator [Actomonas aquatica]|uniref:AraC family transcriptional regulator n=1 Tax=Actomonas aquatica TaxID=2866162 RepID=A0ABZ1CBH4_9BACT|nr:AraC family transcriptional regulator [Opitutus sp. WL0086]WRQ88939.1 AraC family transcriptional regulator [Opitutus sp. WL0086]